MSGNLETLEQNKSDKTEDIATIRNIRTCAATQLVAARHCCKLLLGAPE